MSMQVKAASKQTPHHMQPQLATYTRELHASTSHFGTQLQYTYLVSKPEVFHTPSSPLPSDKTAT